MAVTTTTPIRPGAVVVTPEASRKALSNDLRELHEAFNPHVVKIEQEQGPTGTMCQLKFTVDVPTHVLETEYDTQPKPVDSILFRILVFQGYPRVKPKVFYPANRRLASVNVFSNGVQCTDNWGQYSSLLTLAEKTVRDIIHDPAVTRYDSMAYDRLESWQREREARGAFPSVPLWVIRNPAATRRAAPPPPPPPPTAARRPVPLPRRG